jgi:TPR repeat protein
MALKRPIEAEDRPGKKPFNTECPCCLEDIDTVLPCNHGICDGCLVIVGGSLSPCCPLCRSEIDTPDFWALRGFAAHEREYYDLAFDCYRRAAEGGEVSVMNNLAYFLENGIGCDQDTALAETWLQRAIDAGDLDAMYNRGANHYNRGDYQEAYSWFIKAGLKGHIKAMKTLIFMFANQVGMKQSLGLADFWSKRLYPDGPERTKYEEAAAKELEEAEDESDDEGPISL